MLSSVGLGTGLHTFLLYLGPHIASVTLAAYECGSTDFPSPPYPDSIVCPGIDRPNRHFTFHLQIETITGIRLGVVRAESCLKVEMKWVIDATQERQRRRRPQRSR